ncbi:hypothetical protein FisN_20Hh029 [Fistulifera solaris]|uniref:Uncharacterized protein n=1 Tax=Fistulifera solaris TaxID=1519565 RepID=A0A1Z5KC57_FISSO|nr:hypothetical protein FisN_20Hh029 [Fistulifera solaris]|eukprot:GAX23827.1 hypothetical protein FisN_20Hh029 [Fistulifera solaris]
MRSIRNAQDKEKRRCNHVTILRAIIFALIVASGFRILGSIQLFLFVITTSRTNGYSSTITTTPLLRNFESPPIIEFPPNSQSEQHNDSKRYHGEIIQPPTTVIATRSNNLPFAFADRKQHEMTSATFGMNIENLSFIATVREYSTGNKPTTNEETPNFYDMLDMFDCLPSEACMTCLAAEDEVQGGNCELCQGHCSCYCKSLCLVRPPPKPLVAEWRVERPTSFQDPDRHIPRIIHQTWFEPITREKYPKMSQLVQSFHQAGWQYEFYDDNRASQFLKAHFPPAVREAYDALLPGAYKADLFRYCVLLIMGGVYADVDVLLECNLDELIPPSVGFMAPQDTPGTESGQRYCLWNGFLAAAPAHPFLAQAIQNVVNHVRNRYTSIDYDDMLCPNPDFSVSHTWDTLLTSGPCILGASVNDVLGLHRQTGFEPGDIAQISNRDVGHSDGADHTQMMNVSPDDARSLIPGRSIILKQDRKLNHWHRFVWEEMDLVAISTDLPEYEDRPKSLVHYSETHQKFEVYGLEGVYRNSLRSNEEITISVCIAGELAVSKANTDSDSSLQLNHKHPEIRE